MNNPLPKIEIDTKKNWIFKLAQEIERQLRKKTKVNNELLAEIANSLNDNWQWHDIYEALEVAQNLNIMPLLRNKEIDEEKLFHAILELEKICPTQRIRDSTQIDKQQFSTPLSYSYCAYLLAQIDSQDIVLEPSAGNGALAIFPAFKAKETVLNEIDTTRNHNLNYLFADEDIYQVNGEQLDDRLPVNIRPNVILLNPPFSKSLHQKGKDRNAVKYHFYSSLKRLTKNGRLVIISNESFCAETQSYREFFTKISKIASLEASFTVSGKVYAQRGTNIKTRLSLFRKNKQITNPYKTSANTSLELYEAVNDYLNTTKRNKIIKHPAFVQESLFLINETENYLTPKTEYLTPETASRQLTTKIKSIDKPPVINWEDSILIDYSWHNQ